MAAGKQSSHGVRDVTDAEINYFLANGWAKLPALVSAAEAEELLDRAKKRMGDDAASYEEREGVDLKHVTFFKDYHYISNDDEYFRDFVTDPKLGQNAARLLGRETAMRLASDSLAVKMPASVGDGSSATGYHQDHPYNSLDRGWVVTWIALDHIPAARGSMRFHEGSQALGSMGMRDDDGIPLVDKWERRLQDYPLSEPIDLAPGDATVHSSLVVHGAPANTTEKPRWAYIVSHYPADARFTGQPGDAFKLKRVNIKPFDVIDDPAFPIVYDPNSDVAPAATKA